MTSVVGADYDMSHACSSRLPMKEDWRHVQPALNHDIPVLTDQVVIVWDDGICSAKTTDLEAHRTAFVDDKEDAARATTNISSLFDRTMGRISDLHCMP